MSNASHVLVCNKKTIFKFTITLQPYPRSPWSSSDLSSNEHFLDIKTIAPRFKTQSHTEARLH